MKKAERIEDKIERSLFPIHFYLKLLKLSFVLLFYLKKNYTSDILPLSYVLIFFKKNHIQHLMFLFVHKTYLFVFSHLNQLIFTFKCSGFFPNNFVYYFHYFLKICLSLLVLARIYIQCLSLIFPTDFYFPCFLRFQCKCSSFFDDFILCQVFEL